MKHYYFIILLVVFMSMTSNKAKAYDIAVENADGVTIYYNYINGGSELEVTSGWYSGSVNIPESVTSMDKTRYVTSIGEKAFFNCRRLNSITIPKSVTNIGDDAFDGCKLNSVYVTDLKSWCEINFNKASSNPFPYANHLYMNGSEITDLVIPDNVTSIGKFAFYKCKTLTSVTIPNSVTTIGDDAFYGCKRLTSITIGNSVESIGDYAFYYCEGLTSITIPNSVKNIGDGVFSCCSGLTSVTIPNSVTSIGKEAFVLCSGLTSVTIPNSVKNIGDSVFSCCKGLTSVTIPNSVTSIGNRAFWSCVGLTSVTIGNSVENIGEHAFGGCNSLTSVHISDLAAWCKITFNVKEGDTSSNPLYYAHHLYLNGSEITNLIIPNSVTSIGSNTFSNCDGLTSVTIGDSVESIGDYAFSNCTGLPSITIPNSVTSIGEAAFYGCKLQEVISMIESPFNISTGTFSFYYLIPIDTSTFYYYYTILYVPVGTADKYKSTSGWNSFRNIVESDPSGLQSIILDKDTNSPIYDLNGRKLQKPSKGINIIGGKKIKVN